jgi:hypothetical protein
MTSAPPADHLWLFPIWTFSWHPGSLLLPLTHRLIWWLAYRCETLREVFLGKPHAIPIQVGIRIRLSEHLLALASTLLILTWSLEELILPAVTIRCLTGALGAWLFTHLRAIKWLNQQPILSILSYIPL